MSCKAIRVGSLCCPEVHLPACPPARPPARPPACLLAYISLHPRLPHTACLSLFLQQVCPETRGLSAPAPKACGWLLASGRAGRLCGHVATSRCSSSNIMKNVNNLTDKTCDQTINSQLQSPLWIPKSGILSPSLSPPLSLLKRGYIDGCRKHYER